MIDDKPVESDVPVYVGLDMSLTGSGVCIKQGGKFTLDTIKTNPKTCDNDLMRLRHIVNKAMSMIPKNNVKMICIEDFFTPMGGHQMGAAIGLAMLGATMRLALYEAGYPMWIISPSQLKKFATGKGVGQKSIVVREVYKRWGIDTKDDNQADSVVLAYMAEALCITEKRPQYQVDVLKVIMSDRPRYNVGWAGAARIK